MGACEIHFDFVAADRYLYFNVNVLLSAKIGIQHTASCVNAIRPVRNFRPEFALAVGENIFDCVQYGRESILLHNLFEPLLTDAAAPDHRVQVALIDVRQTSVCDQHAPHVAPEFAFVIQLQWRETKTLLVYFSCSRVRTSSN